MDELYAEYPTPIHDAMVEYMPLIIILLVLILIIAKIRTKCEYKRMQILLADIRSEQRKLNHDRAEFERRLHIMQ